MNNLIIDEYRKQDETSLDAILAAEGKDEGAFDEMQDHSMHDFLDQLDGAQALAVVGELPDIYREVLIFRFVDGLRPSEICDLIEETENTVSVRLHRGLKLLKKIIDEQIDIREMRRRQKGSNHKHE